MFDALYAVARACRRSIISDWLYTSLTHSLQINQSFYHILFANMNSNFVNISTHVAGYQKAAELIKLVTYCNNVNAYCAD